MKIFQAGIENLDQVVALFDQYRQFYKEPSDISGARRFLSQRLSQQQSVIFLALDSGISMSRALGFTQLYPSFSSTSMRRLWILNDLFVLSEARQQGVARALMERARVLAVETDAEGLALETAADNLNAQRLYEKLGYRRDEVYFRYNLITTTTD